MDLLDEPEKTVITDAEWEEMYIKHLAYLDGFKEEDWKMNLYGKKIFNRGFTGRNFFGTSFFSASLDQVTFSSCDLTYADLSRTELWDVQGYSCRGRSMAADFTKFNKTTFTFCDFTGTRFNFCDFKECILWGSLLRNCDFSYSNFLPGCEIATCDFTGSDFTGTCYDYSQKPPDELPDFVYTEDGSGKTCYILKGAETYMYMPDPFLYVPADGLNKALRLRKDQIDAMMIAFASGWKAETIAPDTRYKAVFTLYDTAGELLFRMETKTFSSEEKLTDYLESIYAHQAKQKTCSMYAEILRKLPADAAFAKYKDWNSSNK